MDTPASPPKRLTRARAATRAATSSTAASAAKSKATAAAKAKATSSTKDAAPVARKSVKRKTRSDDHEDETDVEGPAKRPPPASRTATRATRGPGRPKKTVDQDPEPKIQPAPRAARGRPPKKAASDPVEEEAAPVRASRTRAKKTQPDHGDNEDVDDLAPDPVKKATRGRPPGTATSTSAPTSKPVKKTVTFAEPDKENVLPVTGARKTAVPKPADTPATGMRAKPVRKPAGTGRATRTTATKKPIRNAGDKQAPMPLSPKKATQLSANRDRDADSEDELAMDRTPARPLQRSPVKLAVDSKPPTQAREEDSQGEEEDLALPPAESTILLGSPVRRPPQSPFRNSMMSPAKRIDGLQLTRPAAKDALHSSASPLKASLLQSPAKRPHMPLKPVDLTSASHEQNASPFKQSLFQSPAKRLFSPFKPARASEEPTDIRSPAPTPVLLCTPPAVDEANEAEVASLGHAIVEAEAVDPGREISPSEPDFNGRMSTLLPRDADPTLDQATSNIDDPAEDDDCETIVLEEEKEQVEFFEQVSESMALDEPEAQLEGVAIGDISTTPPDSPPRETLNLFGLRQSDLLPFDTTYSESEGELTRVMTPSTVSPVKQMRGSTMRPRTSGFGFTPLARRFDEWQARSPQKTPKAGQSAEVKEDAAGLRESMKNTFFEDEMCVRPDDEANDSVDDTEPLTDVPEIKDPVVEDISITDEDLELAAEANEMSVMSPEQVESMLNLDGNDDTISEASQEYGDENEIPGQIAHFGFGVPPVTPQRFIRREFHTVSKVPLKPADESTPPPRPSLRKRRHSISRLSVARPTHTLSRSATVISYSPSPSMTAHVDDSAFEEAAEESFHERSESVPPPETPSKSEAWLPAETPARTPRPDVNPTVLRGATVFVDVHTMDGADASAIFVELLTQMGARCVNAWHWNPSDEDASSKIGITHVVYKDGGKRTMEKVHETGGVVQCVGVGWVLE